MWAWPNSLTVSSPRLVENGELIPTVFIDHCTLSHQEHIKDESDDDDGPIILPEPVAFSHPNDEWRHNP